MQLKDIEIGKRYKVIYGAQHDGWEDTSIGKIGIVEQKGTEYVFMDFEDGDVDYGEAGGLQPVSPTCFEELRAGDTVISEDGKERAVLFGNGLVIIIINIFDSTQTYSKIEFEENGYTIATEKSEEVTELTLDEVAKRLGIPAGTLKIKKD